MEWIFMALHLDFRFTEADLSSFGNTRRTAAFLPILTCSASDHHGCEDGGRRVAGLILRVASFCSLALLGWIRAAVTQASDPWKALPIRLGSSDTSIPGPTPFPITIPACCEKGTWRMGQPFDLVAAR